MTDTKHCSKCGGVLGDATLEGLCPKCLALLAFTPEPLPEPGSASSTPIRSTLRYFGDYELLEEIARGGMGVVFKARQVSLDRIVAVKMLLSGQFAKKEFVDRFRAEARAAANLQHPNIVAIHEVGEQEGQHYFSMDYVPGRHLGELVRDQPLPVNRAAAYLKKIAEAIHYAHERGVLHRDLKPSNILLDLFDAPRVTDFGLAKQLHGDSDLTLSGQMIGTPRYMPPEQARGRREDMTMASDIYSLGAILYHLTTGRAPFEAESTEGVLQQVLQNEPVAPRLLNRSVPQDLETICLKCLEKEPRRRYASARDLADELGRFLNDKPILARRVGVAGRLARWCRRKPALAVLTASLLLVGLAGLTGILWQWQRAEANAMAAQQLAARESTQRQRAQEAVTMLELQRAEDLMEKDEIVMGMAYLARIVHQQPTNRIAAQRLLSALTQRNFALPVGRPLQHEKRVWDAEFSPDGRRVATASVDFTARVWDAQTGEPLTAPLQHKGRVRAAHFSPDGQSLLTCGDESEAPLWEISTGRRFGPSMAHEKQILKAEFNPDGSRILTASEDGTARVWNATTGELLLRPLRHQGPLFSAHFSPDSRRIVTASADKTAQVWDAQTGQPLSKPLLHRNRVTMAEFSPDGNWIVTAVHGGITAEDFSTCVWDITSGQPVTRSLIHYTGIYAAHFSPEGERIVTALDSGTAQVWKARDWTRLVPDLQHQTTIGSAEFGPEGRRILTASYDFTARLWDADTGEALTAPMQHEAQVWSARLSPDGLAAVTASSDKTARLWDVRLGGMRSHLMRHESEVTWSEFSPDGESVVTASRDGTAQVWNLHTGQPQGPALPHQSWVVAARFSPDGERIATGSLDGTARIWDVRTGHPLTEPMRHGTNVHLVQFTPDGQTLATASWVDSTVRLWNVRTGQPQGEPMPQPEVHVLSLSPDGRSLLSDDFNRDVGQIRDVESHQLLLELRGHEAWLAYGEFSSDGQRVLTASADGTARIWDARTGKELFKLRHKGHVPFARFSRDDRRVVTASHDATAQAWDALTGQPVGELMRHRSKVTTAEFSPDGMLVVTGSEDGTMRLWDASTGRPVTEPFPHRGKVRSARFSPDGRRVLTATDSGEAHLWDVPCFEIGNANSEIQNGELLADLAEIIIGKHVTAQGALESASQGSLTQIRLRIAELPQDADFTRWLEWFFADRSLRTISPYSQITMPQYIQSRAEETNVTSWREALMLSPTNGLAFAQMARHYLRQTQSTNSIGFARADWASRQAVKYAPRDGLAWKERRTVLERDGRWGELLTEAEAAIQRDSAGAAPWHAKAQALAQLNQAEAALSSCNRALENTSVQSDLLLRSDILATRAFAFRQLGRLTEASTDHAAACGLPARDPAASDQLIDLGLFYNGGGNEKFPGSIQRLAGTDFDFRGWIHLDLHLVNPAVTDLPERVDNIPVEQPCRRLHFLHTAVSSSERSRNAAGTREEKFRVSMGTIVGNYVIHYSDGQQAEVPIIYGQDVLDYWHYPESAPDGSAPMVAWKGSSPSPPQVDATTRLYKTSWENPRPSVAIRTLDFVYAKTPAVPVLVAITAEP